MLRVCVSTAGDCVRQRPDRHGKAAHNHPCIIRSLNSSWLAYNVICGMLRAQAVQELFSRFEGFGCSKDEVVRALKQEDNRTERAAAVLLERYPDAQ